MSTGLQPTLYRPPPSYQQPPSYPQPPCYPQPPPYWPTHDSQPPILSWYVHDPYRNLQTDLSVEEEPRNLLEISSVGTTSAPEEIATLAVKLFGSFATHVYQPDETSSPERLLINPDQYLEEKYSTRLRLLHLTNPLPISCDPRNHTPSQEIRDLAIKVSGSRLPSHSTDRCYQVFQGIKKYLNNQTRSSWEKEFPKTVQCLNPSWGKNCRSIGGLILKIRLEGERKQFDPARNTYTEALKNGHIDSKTFDAYLNVLHTKLSSNENPHLTEEIKKLLDEAVEVYITAIRLNLESFKINESFCRIIKMCSSLEQSRDLPHQTPPPDQVLTFQEFAASVHQLVQIPISPAATLQSKEALLTQAREFLGETCSDYLRLLAQANTIPICWDPADLAPSPEIIALAHKVSLSELPSDPADPCYQVFQNFVTYLNNQTISTWEKKFSATLQCLNPSWETEIKNTRNVARYIAHIKLNGQRNAFHKAKNRYIQALKAGDLDSKTFGTYLYTLIVRKNKSTTPESLDQIRNEAATVLITALRLGLGNEVINDLFKEIMSEPKQSRD